MMFRFECREVFCYRFFLTTFLHSSEIGNLDRACRALSDLKQAVGVIFQGLLEVSIFQLLGYLGVTRYY